MPDEMLAPDITDPFSKSGAAAILQRGWRGHIARRATRAVLEWRESLQRKSHRAYPGSLKGLQPPSTAAQVAQVCVCVCVCRRCRRKGATHSQSTPNSCFI
jgi:hypothetical protein